MIKAGRGKASHILVFAYGVPPNSPNQRRPFLVRRYRCFLLLGLSFNRSLPKQVFQIYGQLTIQRIFSTEYLSCQSVILPSIVIARPSRRIGRSNLISLESLSSYTVRNSILCSRASRTVLVLSWSLPPNALSRQMICWGRNSIIPRNAPAVTRSSRQMRSLPPSIE